MQTDHALDNMGNILSSTIHLLPGCDGCLVLSINITAKHMDTVLKLLKINSTVTAEEVNLHSVYLLGRKTDRK
ncbi:hypothetical protein F7725_024648 [Dissostichus mawsoni]|uniref:Uncharacterized protein n=1 Tax=Dissostichus mawsoni TaxID=36200 RepID=A0A7J5X8W4_DISMA|nr:hypothetical protein F7725_024648 [Dissostichus mawsoni]